MRIEIDLQNLPTDATSTHEIIRAQSEEIEKLRYLVSYFKNLKFARKSERLPLQKECLFDEAETLLHQLVSPKEPPEVVAVRAHKRKRGGRKPFSDRIPREEIIHDIDPAEKKCSCCGDELTEINREVTEKLDIIPVKIVVHKHIRPKYTCKTCLNKGNSAEFKIAPMPPEILPKSIATAGLFAHVLTNKFCDHLPYYRQEKIFQRYGIDINRNNLSNWQIQFYEQYDRLEEFIWRDLLEEKVILADETPLQVLQEAGRSNTTKSYMFAFATSGSAPTTKTIRFFQYRETRSSGFLAERLNNFKGVLASDGFKSYDALCRALQIEHSACWAHTRRKFFEVVKNSSGNSFAAQIIEEIRKLYSIEEKCKENKNSAAEILATRKMHSLKIVDCIFEALKVKRDQIPEKQPLGEAIHYALNQETKLRIFLQNGSVPIDTNAVENAIRPFVVGRKNWLFSGSPRGADSSALIYSLIETAKANGMEPWQYLCYLFYWLPRCQSDDAMRDLLPHRVDARAVEDFEFGVA